MSEPEPAADPAEVELLVAAQRRESARRRRWILAARLLAVGFALWYLETIIIERKDAPFYISLNLFAIFTGVSSLVIYNYYDPSLLLRRVHGPAGPSREAAWLALGRLRHELLPPLLQDLRVPEDERERLIAALDRDDLLRRTTPLPPDRKRFGRVYLAFYVVLASAFAATVVTYEAGP
jgi:hypothetical protein